MGSRGEYFEDGEDHTEYFSGCQVVYWRRRTACTKSHADTAEIQVVVPGQGASTVMEVKLPTDSYKLDEYIRAFGRAFEAGCKYKMREIQVVLGLAR